MNKIGILRDRLYINESLIHQGHLDAFTHRYYTRVIEPVAAERNCSNCQFWQKPWRDPQTGKQQYCHLIGYTEEDSCSDFEAKTVSREVENILETFKRVGNVYAFARGDLHKIANTFPDFQLIDERSAPPIGVDLKFTSQLRADQMPIVQQWLTAGHGIIQSPTGSGKSVLLSYLIATLGLKTLVLSHEIRHLKTLYERICEHTNVLALEKELGIKVIDQFIDGQGVAPITLSTFQAWNSEKGRAKMLEHQDSFGLVWVDECFPGSTLVDGRRIDSLRAGDVVSCFDPNDPSKVLVRKIKRVMVRVPSGLVRLTIGGKTLICTPNHPLWTADGWVPAASCTGKDILVCVDEEGSEKTTQRSMRSMWRGYGSPPSSAKLRVILPALQDRTSRNESEESNAPLFALWGDDYRAGETKAESRTQGKSVLHGRAYAAVAFCGAGSPSGRNEQEVCICSDEGKQSNEGPCQCRQDGSSDEGSYIFESWREWTANQTTSHAGQSSWVGYGSSDRDRSGERFASISSELLQGGHRRSFFEAGDRSGWAVTQVEKVEVLGQTQNASLRSTRVDRVEVLERGSDGTFGRVCPDGLVYNLEVEGTHTYFANGVGVSNCHHTSAHTYHNVFSNFNALYRGGTTATPTRKDQTHWATYDAIGPITARGGNEMLNCSVTWIPTGVNIPAHLFRFPKTGWTKMLNYIAQDNTVRELLLARVIADIDAGYKPLVILERRDMVFWLERMLYMSGYNVETIVGQQAKTKKNSNALTSGQSFDAISQRLLDGTLHVVIGTNVLNENIDIRPLDALHLPFPSANEEMEEQRAGRIRRPLHPRDIEAGHIKKPPVIRVYTYGGHRASRAAVTKRKVVYARLNFPMVEEAGPSMKSLLKFDHNA